MRCSERGQHARSAERIIGKYSGRGGGGGEREAAFNAPAAHYSSLSARRGGNHRHTCCCHMPSLLLLLLLLPWPSFYPSCCRGCAVGPCRQAERIRSDGCRPVLERARLQPRPLCSNVCVSNYTGLLSSSHHATSAMPRMHTCADRLDPLKPLHILHCTRGN